MKLLTTTLLILSTFTLSWGVCVLYFVLVCKRGCPFIYLESISFQTGLLLNSSVNFLVSSSSSNDKFHTGRRRLIYYEIRGSRVNSW